MNVKLKGKNVLITGASGGIGERIANKAAESGANLVLIARRKDKLKDVATKIHATYGAKVLYYQVDVSNLDELDATFSEIMKEINHVDVLVNNAGFGVFESFNEASLTDIKLMFDVNVLGLMACTQRVLPKMLERDSGHIINIASQAGKLATPKSSGYCATKHAVIGFTNSLRLELAKTNIFVSAVNPGPIDTNFFDIADKSGNYVKNIKNFMLKSDDVAEKIISLMYSRKRELNLPVWMNIGSVLYNLFPKMADTVMGKMLDRK